MGEFLHREMRKEPEWEEDWYHICEADTNENSFNSKVVDKIQNMERQIKLLMQKIHILENTSVMFFRFILCILSQILNQKYHIYVC